MKIFLKGVRLSELFLNFIIFRQKIEDKMEFSLLFFNINERLTKEALIVIFHYSVMHNSIC